jgi:DnaJ-class molecular chaperone
VAEVPNVQCRRCHGAGEVVEIRGVDVEVQTCRTCDGQRVEPCPECLAGVQLTPDAARLLTDMLGEHDQGHPNAGRPVHPAPGEVTDTVECPECRGVGTLPADPPRPVPNHRQPCTRCRGRGRVPRDSLTTAEAARVHGRPLVDEHGVVWHPDGTSVRGLSEPLAGAEEDPLPPAS